MNWDRDKDGDMTGFLSDHQIEYILFHLNHSFALARKIRERMLFVHGANIPDVSGRIIFLLSDKDLVREQIIKEEGIPVLFPGTGKKGWYHLDEDNLVFHHDLLKSAFFLLSGYQELQPERLDPMGRYPHELSIQYYLGITGKPLVNYYFRIIKEGIAGFCRKQGIEFCERSPFRNFGFFLTHDVDSLDTYTFNETVYRLKQALGLSPSPVSGKRAWRIAMRYVSQTMKIIGRENPHMDFPDLRMIEEHYGYRSAFYFLPKDRLHVDAYYSFRERRFRLLLDTLHRQQCEIGIHGTVRSSTSLEALEENISMLEKYSPRPVRGIRQHRLMYDRSVTPSIQQQAGLLYDTTLGFPGHEGFRNSYCLPFRLYDHRNDAMMDLWEIPLTVMDVTLFHYRGHSMQDALASVKELLEEIVKFNGVFVLLWHNGQNHEFLLPGITAFYHDLIGMIAGMEPENLLGGEIIRRMEKE
ncbi:MAG: polysaccharide deacetylase family protein [Bacteroidales bacterium]